MSLQYNISYNEGDPTSVTAFIGGESYVASLDHPNFTEILDALGNEDPQTIIDLFDLSIGVGARFDRLSERVLVQAGRVYFDGIEVHNALTDTIVRFYRDDQDDFSSLVAFMEKIETNPNAHSRQHLFRWLTKHNFTICPDGDFLAYKGVSEDSKSISSGEAIVNNELVRGRISNLPGTIIEMPRDQVQFDPAVGCSTGLHAGNWRYANYFGPKVLRVKINPRDVVSVPVDSGDEKLRTCRYRVLGVVTEEDRSLLYLGDLDKRTRQVVTESVAPVAETDDEETEGLPKFYEQYSKAQFSELAYNTLRWLAKEWEVKVGGSRPDKPTLVDGLMTEAASRMATWEV